MDHGQLGVTETLTLTRSQIKQLKSALALGVTTQALG